MKALRFFLALMLLNLVFFLLFRLVFLGAFISDQPALLGSSVAKAFWIGFKFDLRLVASVGLAFLVLSRLSGLRLESKRGVGRLQILSATVFAAYTLVYLADFGYYSYLHSRIDATIFDFVLNPMVSAEMVWQTYPVVWGLLGWGLLVYGYSMLLKRFVFGGGREQIRPLWQMRLQMVLAVLFSLAAIYGKFSSYPLRWSDAYFSNNVFLSALGLNPVLNILDTFTNRSGDYDEKAVREHYDLMASFLGVSEKNPKTLNFVRKVSARPEGKKLNVVYIVLESFAAFKTGTFGHPLKPTPFFDEIAQGGVLFTNFYVPSEGTARSMFGQMTGIPDVNPQQTASRNPRIVDQHTIMNDFMGYEKFYFLGGSANWGNIRGVFAHNVSDIHIYEEGDFKASRTDVWGISDLDLLLEAHEVLKAQEKPFVAVIQTAGFHRPFTIPENRGEFKLLEMDEDGVKSTGFHSLAEFNSMRFTDYALEVYFAKARESSYYKDTLFVFHGDHGLPDLKAKQLPLGFREHGLTRFHVPLLLYAPLHLKSELRTELASELDTWPTIGGILGLPHLNTTLGRDLFRLPKQAPRIIFTYVYHENPPTMGVLEGDLYFKMREGIPIGLFSFRGENYNQDMAAQLPEKAEQLKKYTEGFYETARYLLYHNKKSARPR